MKKLPWILLIVSVIANWGLLHLSMKRQQADKEYEKLLLECKAMLDRKDSVVTIFVPPTVRVDTFWQESTKPTISVCKR